MFLDLNSEYAKAKKCVKDLTPTVCNFTSQDEEAYNFQLDDYNPFCVNNRDPGATGSAHCSDFQPPATTTPTMIPCNKGDVISVKQLILFFMVTIYLLFM